MIHNPRRWFSSSVVIISAIATILQSSDFAEKSRKMRRNKNGVIRLIMVSEFYSITPMVWCSG